VAGQRVRETPCKRFCVRPEGRNELPCVCELGTAERAVSTCNYSMQLGVCVAPTPTANWCESLYLYSLDVADSRYIYLFRVFSEI